MQTFVGIATRYDKLAANDLASIRLALISYDCALYASTP
jgi:hypothetical protein